MNKPNFAKHKFWAEVRTMKKEYSIRVAKKPNSRSAKRITILLSTAYLTCGGSIHWVQCLESALYRQCKSKRLDSERLKIEDHTYSYICRKTDKRGNELKNYGKKYFSNEFQEWSICTTDTNSPKAELIANILTDYLAMEEEQDYEQQLLTDSQRKRDVRHSRPQEGRFSKTKEARFALR